MTVPGGLAVSMEAGAAEARAQRLRLYLGGQASWYISLGIQFVIFPFLVTQVLHEPAARLGIAQMSLMAPSLLFMLLGGTVADHGDARRILIRVHMLAVAPPAMLAMGVQMGGQLAGMLVAAFAALVGAPGLLLFQAAMLVGGGFATTKLQPLPPTHRGTGEGRLAQILDGIATARAHGITFAVIGLNFAVGLFYVGSFMVVLPLMVRDVYHSTVSEFAVKFAIINISFWGGTIFATMMLLKIGHIARRGRVMMGAVTSGLVVLALLALTMPFPVLCFLCFLWGIGAGTTMTMGRTIVQLAAPPSHRARVLALYQLGFSGGAPIGSLIMWFLVGGLGIHTAVLVPSAVMICILMLLFLSPIWHYHAEEI